MKAVLVFCLLEVNTAFGKRTLDLLLVLQHTNCRAGSVLNLKKKLVRSQKNVWVSSFQMHRSSASAAS